MKNLLIALLLTFVLAFTYSCSDTAGDPSSGGPDDNDGEIIDPNPEPEVPEPDPDDEIIETGKEWKNINFLDNVSVPNPDGITVVDKFIISTAQGTETITQTEAIVDNYTYDQFKTYITTLKASELYTDKTHSNILYVLTEESLLPATLEDTKSTYFVFDNDTHYAIITFYGDNYIDPNADATRSTARPNLSVQLTRKDPFSKIGGKLKVMKDVLWADVKFEEGAELPDAGTVDLLIYDNATDKQEMYIDIKSMSVDIYKSYLGAIRENSKKFTRHRAIPASAATGISTYLKDGKSATWVVTDNLSRYISIAYTGSSSPVYNGTNFKITINSKDPFVKGSGSKRTNLSIADAITELPPIITIPVPAFVTSKGELVTFKDTKYGKEIRFEVEDNQYTTFRDYIGKPTMFNPHGNTGLMAKSFINQTHAKVPLEDLVTFFAFGIALPSKYEPQNTGAWSFVEKNKTEYTSFIWHGKDSPNNPYPDRKTDIFIIERMSHDPMWFLP